MKKQFLYLTILIIGFCKMSHAQEFNKNIDKDSLFQVILQEFPAEKRSDFKKIYEEGNEQDKEFFLFMFSMPRSSKKELIDNYEQKSVEIEQLKINYAKLVPDSLIVSIEFNPADKILSTAESIDLKIYRKTPNRRSSVVRQEWNLYEDSEKLSEMLTIVGWTPSTLIEIKQLLDSANCMSIENEENTSIGFARSGMGKYYYKIFDESLSDSEVKKYDNGCTYIYYKNNIVLEYGGGAIGPQCFPDE